MKRTMQSIIRISLLILLVSGGCFNRGCDPFRDEYYSFWEKLGKEKRDLLRGQITKARDDQKEAAEELEDALTRLKALTGFSGGELEKMHTKLLAEYEQCEARSKQINERIVKINEIATDLFTEWEKEITEITSLELSTNSRKQLTATKLRYDQLYQAMRKANASITPVLANLKNYVLYLKHNLNAQAIGALQGELTKIESEVDLLKKDLDQSIAEAELFLKDFK